MFIITVSRYRADQIVMCNGPSTPNDDGEKSLNDMDEIQQDYQLTLVEMFPNGLDQSIVNELC